jgi:hypothetical protein
MEKKKIQRKLYCTGFLTKLSWIDGGIKFISKLLNNLVSEPQAIQLEVTVAHQRKCSVRSIHHFMQDIQEIWKIIYTSDALSTRACPQGTKSWCKFSTLVVLSKLNKPELAGNQSSVIREINKK